jgi:hypothetical protein
MSGFSSIGVWHDGASFAKAIVQDRAYSLTARSNLNRARHPRQSRWVAGWAASKAVVLLDRHSGMLNRVAVRRAQDRPSASTHTGLLAWRLCTATAGVIVALKCIVSEWLADRTVSWYAHDCLVTRLHAKMGESAR